MLEDYSRKKAKRIKRTSRLTYFDGQLDHWLFGLVQKFASMWEQINEASRKLYPRGWKRGLFECASEGINLGVAGLIVLALLAQVSLQVTQSDWRRQNNFAITFLDRFGNEIGQRGVIQLGSPDLHEYPDHLIKAVLATEDRRFFEHQGVDLLGLLRALTENIRANDVVQGGSTITQQLAKNLFLSNERTLGRKIREAFLAIWLEVNLSKSEILELYLERAYMGGGTFGMAAAADYYFDKNISDLDLAESAMLAGLFKAPARYAPHINLPAARSRAQEVLTNLVQAGFMSEGQIQRARRNPASVVDRAVKKQPDYFLDWAFEEVQQIARDFPTPSLIVRTTLDVDLQRAAEESVEFHLRQFGEESRFEQAAIVLLENNGAVRAVVGGTDYGKSQYNRATQALRQAGSSFKPYVYAVAMEKGFRPNSVIRDAPINWNGWSPKNYSGRFSGRVTLSNALIRSINTVPVRLAHDHLSIPPIVELAREMGVKSDIGGHKTIVLGTAGVTVLDQATGYLGFANGGVKNTRHLFTSMTDHQGNVLYEWKQPDIEKNRVLSEDSAHKINRILVQVPERGTARRAALDSIRAAGKTGTTQSYRDAWFVGYTGNYTAAVWVGNDDYSPTNKVTGGSIPAMMWKRLMSYAHRNVELKPIPGVKYEDGQLTIAQAEEPDPLSAQAVLGTGRRRLKTETGRAVQSLLQRLERAPDLQPSTSKPAS